MNKRTIVSGLLVAALGFSSLSFAQPALREAQRDVRDARQEVQDARRDLRRADTPRERRQAERRLQRAERQLREERQDRREVRRYYNARGPEFRRGGRLPSELRQRHYVVSDWRGHRLSAPPRGYQWVQVGPDYVLAAVATGIIVNMILHSQ
jgi:Ni/Co efflux regulator RcnB